MKRQQAFLLMLLVSSLLAGCKTEGLYENVLAIGTKVTLTKGVAFHEQTFDRVFYLEAGAGKASLKTLYQAQEGENILWLKPGESGQEVFYGFVAPSDPRDTRRTNALLQFRVKEGKVDRYPVGSYFDTLALSPGGRFLVLYHGGSLADQGSDIYNPNEVTILEPAKAAGDFNPKTVSIGIEGQRIEHIAFLDSLSVGGRSCEFGVFMARGAVKLIDLADPALTGIKIQLVTDTDTRNVVPVEALAKAGDALRDPMIFLRASGSQDIYAVSLSLKTGGGFSASLNQFEAGDTPYGMTLVEEPGETPTLLVLSWSNAYAGRGVVHVIDIDTADTFTISIGDTPTRILSRAETAEHEVVLYGDQTAGVHFLKLDALSDEKGGNLEHLLIPERIRDVIPLGSDRLLLLPGSGSDLIILDLATRNMTRLFSAASYDWTQAQLSAGRFFLVPGGKDRIDTLDLTNGHPDSLVLDDAVVSLHLLSGSMAGVVFHDTPTGRVTVFPLSQPTRDKATVIDGLWLKDILDDTEVPR